MLVLQQAAGLILLKFHRTSHQNDQGNLLCHRTPKSFGYSLQKKDIYTAYLHILKYIGHIKRNHVYNMCSQGQLRSTYMYIFPVCMRPQWTTEFYIGKVNGFCHTKETQIYAFTGRKTPKTGCFMIMWAGNLCRGEGKTK